MELDKNILIGGGIGLGVGGLITAGAFLLSNSISLNNLAKKIGVDPKQLKELKKAFDKKDYNKAAENISEIAAKNPNITSNAFIKFVNKNPSVLNDLLAHAASCPSESGKSETAAENIRVVK
jgi:hypothetical protein